MDFLAITNRYYSEWLGEADLLNINPCGAKFIYSQERNKTQCGYSQPFDLYVFYQSGGIIFSYGDRCLKKIDELKERICAAVSVEELSSVLKKVFGGYCQHSIKYVFRELPQKLCLSRPLEISDYPRYLDFFSKVNPNCKNTDWLFEYFEEMVSDRLCWGLFTDDILVSCTDAPDMPFMRDQVQEIGINTLEGYRKNGYAIDVCTACAKEMIQRGKCPQWSASADNIASQKLAERTGYVKLADVLTVTLPRTLE